MEVVVAKDGKKALTSLEEHQDISLILVGNQQEITAETAMSISIRYTFLFNIQRNPLVAVEL